MSGRSWGRRDPGNKEARRYGTLVLSGNNFFKGTLTRLHPKERFFLTRALRGRGAMMVHDAICAYSATMCPLFSSPLFPETGANGVCSPHPRPVSLTGSSPPEYQIRVLYSHRKGDALKKLSWRMREAGDKTEKLKSGPYAAICSAKF
jgi:hypothetical protein